MVDVTTDTYYFTGGWRQFNVPGPVNTVQVELHGAGSGGVSGGRVRGKVRVKGSDVIWILVGEKGRGGATQAGGGETTGGGGAGGDGGSSSRHGGTSGGGASEVRLNGPDGQLIAMAGGAGGMSGDGGLGGKGGNDQGNDGVRANGSSTNVATGGTQSKGGNGGTAADGGFNGNNASDTVSGRGGKGGHDSNDKAYGGGGGGGGYHAGGGGQAGKAGSFPGGGGGGGSSYVGGLHDVDLNDRAGETENGVVYLTYDPDGDPNPQVPTNVKINGAAEAPEFPLHGYNATISARVQDTVSGDTWVTDDDVRLVVLLSPFGDPGPPDDPSRVPYRSVHVGNGVEATGGISSFTLNGLPGNTLYHGRAYSRDSRGQFSNAYVGISFWTNRPPNPPALVSPLQDTDFDSTDTITFQWTPSDPDGDGQAAAQVRYRFATTPTREAGPWNTHGFPGADPSWTVPAADLAPGRWYEWQVATADGLGPWSDWSETRAFFVNAIALPPTLISPAGEEAIYAAENNVFEWQFNTMVDGETQTTADIRYRAVGAGDDEWNLLTGDLDQPGSGPRWLIDAETFVEGIRYEWQGRVHTSSSTLSAWSPSAYFWSVPLPGPVPDIVPIDVTRVQEPLGQHDNKVYVYLRGGKVRIAELSPLYDVQWERKRDDFGSCTIHINKWDPETRELLQTLRPWKHELVVYRNGVRCWEGPIVRRSGNREGLEIEARDVMAYVYRRIMRQGYNDTYQIVAGHQVGLHTVVYRAQRIITNALIYDDPNVLPYLTPIHNLGDAIQSRSVRGYTRMAFEEIDDLAAKAGLDYSVSGRRIILNDTHRPIGRLPELGDSDFSSPPLVTEYGMSYATDFAVTNNGGYYGLATRGRDPVTGLLTGDAAETGFIEQLASEYGESDPAPLGAQSLTPAEIALLQGTLAAQAERNIAARYPIPVIVRVPDNSSLDPLVNLGINQLIPGVWAPLRATDGVVQASQWQKLDSLTVRQDQSGEKISVVFSPAPNGGLDPDADIPEE